MKTRLSRSTQASPPEGLPDAASLAALRAWYEGLSARQAVARYLGHSKADGQSSRGILGRMRRQLIELARRYHREDLAKLLDHPVAERSRHVRAVSRAIEVLPTLPMPQPLIDDDIALWLRPQATQALRARGIKTLAALTVRIPRRRRWWGEIPGLGIAGARSSEAFFAVHPRLTERARALVAADDVRDVVPWEQLTVPSDLDGSRGTFRAPAATCTLRANNDYQAVQAWLALHDSPATQSSYRKEAERLILGRSPSAAGRCRRWRPKTRWTIARSCVIQRHVPSGLDRRGRDHRPNGARSRAGCRPAPQRIRCRCSAQCTAG